jgi:hypothetical protein
VDTSRGSPIKRTNQFFVRLRSYGSGDSEAKRKIAFEIDLDQQRIYAPPDRPFILIACIIETYIKAMDYSTREAMELDLAEFKKFVSAIGIKEKS